MPFLCYWEFFERGGVGNTIQAKTKFSLAPLQNNCYWLQDVCRKADCKPTNLRLASFHMRRYMPVGWPLNMAEKQILCDCN